MAYLTPTVDQFKAQFARDFPFAVPSFGATATATVSGGAVTAVTLATGGQLYSKVPLVSFSYGTASVTAVLTGNAVSGFTGLVGGSGYSTTPPTVTITSQDGDDTDASKVQTGDIVNGQNMALMHINPSLFASQTFYAQCLNLLTAHFVVTNILASTQGLKSQYDWLTIQRTVGNVNSSFNIPHKVSSSPFLSTLTTTRYGAQYLSLISPFLIGNVCGIVGNTTP
jgi:hypothetical protein